MATFIGQVAGMAGFVSFPALQPEFQRLWALSDSEGPHAQVRTRLSAGKWIRTLGPPSESHGWRCHPLTASAFGAVAERMPTSFDVYFPPAGALGWPEEDA